MILAEEYETEEGVFFKGTQVPITDSDEHQKAESDGLIEYCNPAQVGLFDAP